MSRAEVVRLQQQITELQQELARIQRLPTLDWAKASALFMQQLSKLSRKGVDTKHILLTFDKLKNYVTKLEAKLEDMTKHRNKWQEVAEACDCSSVFSTLPAGKLEWEHDD